MKLYCPLCNWDVWQGRCTNTVSHCKGTQGIEGRPREPLDGTERLGDMTGEPRNNGDMDRTNYS